MSQSRRAEPEKREEQTKKKPTHLKGAIGALEAVSVRAVLVVPVDLLEDGDGRGLGPGGWLPLGRGRRRTVTTGRRVGRSLLLVVGVHVAVYVVGVLALVALARGHRRHQRQRRRELAR